MLAAAVSEMTDASFLEHAIIPSMITAPGFTPNFFSSYFVVLNHPIAEVFSTIGTSIGHERVTRLTEFCTAIALGEADTVAIAKSHSLSDITARTLSDDETPQKPIRKLPRQFWTLTETVPLIFGLAHTDVHLTGTLTWDEEAKLALYESQGNLGVLVWKLRIFQEVDASTTRVTEIIRGKCSFWLKGIVQRKATAAHMYVSVSDVIPRRYLTVLQQRSHGTVSYSILTPCIGRVSPEPESWHP